jgi:hypothetical protein
MDIPASHKIINWLSISNGTNDDDGYLDPNAPDPSETLSAQTASDPSTINLPRPYGTWCNLLHVDTLITTYDAKEFVIHFPDQEAKFTLPDDISSDTSSKAFQQKLYEVLVTDLRWKNTSSYNNRKKAVKDAVISLIAEVKSNQEISEV